MLIAKTPLRISFLGGTSDYPSYYKEHGGAVLGTTIDQYCHLIVRRATQFGRYKIVYSKVQECSSVYEIEHPAVRQVLLALGYIHPVEIYYTGDLPARSGMGSSSAFVVGLLKAITELDHDFWEANPDFGTGYWTPERIAKESIYIERQLLNETVGDQDQILCSFGGLNRITFYPDKPFQLEPVFRTALEYNLCANILERHLMLFYTGVERIASDVASAYVPKLNDHHSTLKKIVNLVDEGEEILQSMIHGSDPNYFGELLHQAWELKKSLGEISTPEVDEIYSKALKAGAVGGKLLGSGKGGFLLLFVRPEARHRMERVLALPEVKFSLEKMGSRIIFNG